MYEGIYIFYFSEVFQLGYNTRAPSYLPKYDVKFLLPISISFYNGNYTCLKRGFHRPTKPADKRQKSADLSDFEKIFGRYLIFLKSAD